VDIFPLALTEELIEILKTCAATIAPRDRPRFYEAVDRLLRARLRRGAEAFIVAPAIDLEQPTSRSAQQPRSPFRCRA